LRITALSSRSVNKFKGLLSRTQSADMLSQGRYLILPAL
jgi:hypothetical protein